MIIRQTMKKLLILIAFAAVFLHFYPQPELESWYDQQKSWLKKEISEATDTQIRLNVEKIIESLHADVENFSPEELDYLKEVTADRDTIKTFFHQHCKSDVATDMLSKANLADICRVMTDYQTLM